MVELIDHQEIIDPSEPDRYPYAVVSKNYFGIMTVREEQNIHFIAFSSEQNATVLENDPIWSFEWDCSMGRIKPTIESLVS